MVSSSFALLNDWEGVTCVAAPEGFPHHCGSVDVSIACDMDIFNKKTAILIVHFIQIQAMAGNVV